MLTFKPLCSFQSCIREKKQNKFFTYGAINGLYQSVITPDV